MNRWNLSLIVSLVPRPPPSLCPLQYEKWGEPGNEATDQWAAVLVADRVSSRIWKTH